MPVAPDVPASARISMEVLADAITEVQALDMAAQIALCDEIAAEQPNLFAAILAVLRKNPGEAAT